MSKKSVGDRENFIKGLINEAAWLFSVFMHSAFWLWWVWRQECLLGDVHQTLNPASSATSQSNQWGNFWQFSLKNFMAAEISFSLTRRTMCVSPLRVEQQHWLLPCPFPTITAIRTPQTRAPAVKKCAQIALPEPLFPEWVCWDCMRGAGLI